MELSQGEIFQKPKMQELSSSFMTHRLNVMRVPVKFHDTSFQFPSSAGSSYASGPGRYRSGIGVGRFRILGGGGTV